MEKPRGRIEMTLSFMDDFQHFLSSWPGERRFALTVIAEKTHHSLPLIASHFANCLDRDIDVHEPMTLRECEKVQNILKTQLAPEIDRRNQLRLRERKRIQAKYFETMDKVTELQKAGQWYQAYRTLSYFYGLHSQSLSFETQIAICNDCLRLGEKAGVYFQEQAQWLQRAVELCLTNSQDDQIEEALDFIETFGESLITNSAKGEKLIKSLLMQIHTVALNPSTLNKLYQVSGTLSRVERNVNAA